MKKPSKQCRRLVKKPRRSVWINLDPKLGGTLGYPVSPLSLPGWVEFVERKKK